MKETFSWISLKGTQKYSFTFWVCAVHVKFNEWNNTQKTYLFYIIATSTVREKNHFNLFKYLELSPCKTRDWIEDKFCCVVTFWRNPLFKEFRPLITIFNPDILPIYLPIIGLWVGGFLNCACEIWEPTEAPAKVRGFPYPFPARGFLPRVYADSLPTHSRILPR